MKKLFCEKLAACVCMKLPPSPPVEPPLIRRNHRNGAAGEDFDMKPFDDHDATSEGESTKQLLREIRDLLKSGVRSKEEQRYEDDRENEMKNDWMLAAAVLDRICAIVFVIIFVVGTLIFFIAFASR